jgi:hypothetical protein
LKISPCPLNAIDVVFKRMAVTEWLSLFFVPGLPGWLFQGVTAVGGGLRGRNKDRLFTLREGMKIWCSGARVAGGTSTLMLPTGL